MTETVLANADLVLPDRTVTGAVTLKEGYIASIAEGGEVPAGALDCGGDLIMPGLIELHTDNLERHLEPRPSVSWPHRNAIAAHDGELASVGITTVFDALRVGSIPEGKGRDTRYARSVANELLEMRAEGALRISHFLHLRAEICSQTLGEELATFSPQDRVRLISLMDHTPGERQFRDLDKFKTYRRGKGHMSEAEFAEHVEELQSLKARVGPAHERLALDEAARLGAIMASHDDTTIDHVRLSAARGMNLAEFPTTAEAARACRDARIAVMMGAPNLVRGGSHSGNVGAADLAEAGHLDIVSSDYVPGALLMAGMMLGDLWDDLARGIATITRAPADATGLTDRGRIAPGARADLIRVARRGTTPLVRETWCRASAWLDTPGGSAQRSMEIVRKPS